MLRKRKRVREQKSDAALRTGTHFAPVSAGFPTFTHRSLSASNAAGLVYWLRTRGVRRQEAKQGTVLRVARTGGSYSSRPLALDKPTPVYGAPRQ